MAVEVIFRDIEHDRDVRAERRERFQLKGRDFGNRQAVLAEFFQAGGERLSDIPARDGVFSRGAENMFEQGDHRRFAVRSRDRDERTAESARTEFRLSDHRLSHALEGNGQRVIDGDPRAQYKHVAFFAAGDKLLFFYGAGALYDEFLRRLTHRLVGHVVVEIYLRALCQQILGGGDARTGDPRHQKRLFREIHTHPPSPLARGSDKRKKQRQRQRRGDSRVNVGDLPLRIALLLKMVVKRRHQKDPFARFFVIYDLKDDGYA